MVTCVAKRAHTSRRTGVGGEVLIADNGSTDGTRSIAHGLGRARRRRERGYGAALPAGIKRRAADSS